MSYRRYRQRIRIKPGILIVIVSVLLAAVLISLFYIYNPRSVDFNLGSTGDSNGKRPLEGITLYRDDTRAVTIAEKEFRKANRIADADSLKVVSSEPGTIWLVGPNQGDKTAERDIQEVERTSKEAASQGTTPVYQLYAIPNRDACASYSKGGFSNAGEYKKWIDRILKSLKTPSVFLVETDSIAAIAAGGCLTSAQAEQREQLLKSTVEKLRESPNALAIYLDAGHSEWLPNGADLIGPIARSGFYSSDGIFVNTAFFVTTEDISDWSKKLLDELGGDKKVIIDTSRNGNGVPTSNITGDDRWCNPEGVSLGVAPTINTGIDHVDAFLWIKNVGESDGACNGNPPAGTFVPELAIKLVTNR